MRWGICTGKRPVCPGIPPDGQVAAWGPRLRIQGRPSAPCPRTLSRNLRLPLQTPTPPVRTTGLVCLTRMPGGICQSRHPTQFSLNGPCIASQLEAGRHRSDFIWYRLIFLRRKTEMKRGRRRQKKKKRWRQLGIWPTYYEPALRAIPVLPSSHLTVC